MADDGDATHRCSLLSKACAEDDPDEALARNYADCLMDSNSTVHRIKVVDRMGTVPLDSEGTERLLHQELVRRETTLEEMRLEFTRYCE